MKYPRVHPYHKQKNEKHKGPPLPLKNVDQSNLFKDNSIYYIRL